METQENSTQPTEKPRRRGRPVGSLGRKKREALAKVEVKPVETQ